MSYYRSTSSDLIYDSSTDQYIPVGNHSYYRSPSLDLIYDPTTDRYIPASDLSAVYTQDDAPISRDPVFNNKGVLISYVDSYNDTDMTITIDEDPSVVYTRNLDKNLTWNKTLNKYVGGYKTLTIIPDPEDSTVELIATGYVQDGNSISAEEGTVVNWTVSKQGFPSKSGTITLTYSQVLHISLYYEAEENEAIVDLEGAQDSKKIQSFLLEDTKYIYKHQAADGSYQKNIQEHNMILLQRLK